MVCQIGTRSDTDVVHIDPYRSSKQLMFEDSVAINEIHHCLEGSGELVRPKYITVGSKSPYLVLKAALCSSPSRIRTLLYPHRTSSFVYMCALLRSRMRSEIRGRGYWFRTVTALIFR